MDVLQLSAYDAPFFREQVKILEENGVDCETVIASRMSLTEDSNTVMGRVKSGLAGQHPPYYAYCTARFYPKLLSKTFREEYDIVHFNSGMIAPFVPLQPEQPVVLTLWGDGLVGDRLYGQFSKICKWAAQHSQAVIVRNEEMRSKLPCESAVIPSGVDTEKFRPIPRETARTEVDWETDARVVLFPYKPSRPKKRYPVAQQVVTDAAASFDGDVELRAIHGKSHSQIPYYMNAADALILPSTMEGSPNTVKEAMACNLPVVTTDVGDVRTRLGPVSNSFVATDEDELRDYLLRILESGALSDGRDHVDDVSLEQMGEDVLAVYDDVL